MTREMGCSEVTSSGIHPTIDDLVAYEGRRFDAMEASLDGTYGYRLPPVFTTAAPKHVSVQLGFALQVRQAAMQQRDDIDSLHMCVLAHT